MPKMDEVRQAIFDRFGRLARPPCAIISVPASSAESGANMMQAAEKVTQRIKDGIDAVKAKAAQEWKSEWLKRLTSRDRDF